jgi:hypothetical protein
MVYFDAERAVKRHIPAQIGERGDGWLHRRHGAAEGRAGNEMEAEAGQALIGSADRGRGFGDRRPKLSGYRQRAEVIQAGEFRVPQYERRTQSEGDQ